MNNKTRPNLLITYQQNPSWFNCRSVTQFVVRALAFGFVGLSEVETQPTTQLLLTG